MLYIVTNTGAEIHWHVGEGAPMVFQPKRPKEHWPNGHEKTFPDVNVVVEVYADGAELDHIRQRFVNIPDRKPALSMKWFGEMARFIHANLTK